MLQAGFYWDEMWASGRLWSPRGMSPDLQSPSSKGNVAELPPLSQPVAGEVFVAAEWGWQPSCRSGPARPPSSQLAAVCCHPPVQLLLEPWPCLWPVAHVALDHLQGPGTSASLIPPRTPPPNTGSCMGTIWVLPRINLGPTCLFRGLGESGWGVPSPGTPHSPLRHTWSACSSPTGWSSQSLWGPQTCH